MLPIISGLNVAMFIMCTPSHITPHYGIIRELLHQNHSVVCIIHRDCHEKLNSFQVDLVHNNGLTPKVAETQDFKSLFSTLHEELSSGFTQFFTRTYWTTLRRIK